MRTFKADVVALIAIACFLLGIVACRFIPYLCPKPAAPETPAPLFNIFKSLKHFTRKLEDDSKKAARTVSRKVKREYNDLHDEALHDFHVAKRKFRSLFGNELCRAIAPMLVSVIERGFDEKKIEHEMKSKNVESACGVVIPIIMAGIMGALLYSGIGEAIVAYGAEMGVVTEEMSAVATEATAELQATEEGADFLLKTQKVMNNATAGLKNAALESWSGMAGVALFFHIVTMCYNYLKKECAKAVASGSKMTAKDVRRGLVAAIRELC